MVNITKFYILKTKLQIITFLVCICFESVLCQTISNQATYGRPAEAPYISPYSGGNYEAIRKQGEKLQARYDQNLKYRNDIIDWIYNLKKQSSDVEFIHFLDLIYNKLRKMDNLDFGNVEIRSYLQGVEQEIKSLIDNYNSSIRERPKRLFESANEKMKKNEYREAINEYTDLIRLDNKFLLSFRNRGIAYFETGKHQNAILDLNKYIESIDNDAYAYNYRGWSNYQLEKYSEALADFVKCVELNPENAYNYYSKGTAKSSLNDNYGAIVDYTKAIEIDSKFSMAYNNRGWSKFKMGRYGEALLDLNKAIELDPENWTAYDSRQEIKFALNDLQGCKADCSEAIILNPKCSNSWFFLGRCNYQEGNKSLACENWSKSGELGTKESYDYIKKYCGK